MASGGVQPASSANVQRILVKAMNTLRILAVAAAGLAAAGGGLYWWGGVPSVQWAHSQQSGSAAPAAGRPVLYYRDPGGVPVWSAVPKTDQQGRAFVPVYEDEAPSFDPAPKAQAANADRKVLYYRNPMGLPDTSPVPKKDSMGMDYIPVYEGEDADDGGVVKLSLGKIQRSGVRTEPAELRKLVQPVRAVGAVAIDERRLTIVTLRSDGYIEELFVNTTGQPVREGEPLFRVYSPQIQQAQTDLIVAVGAMQRGVSGADAERSLSGAMQRLRNLAVPEARIKEVRQTGSNPRTIDWPAPASGTVISKRIINGQRVAAGDELYRIADLSTVWVIADVAEADLDLIKPGSRAVVTFRAYRLHPVEGEVTLIYPEVKTETRTARVRIELPNPDGRLKADMYADVLFRAGADEGPVVTIPHSAVIDSGTQQVVFVAKGEGRFEPRAVKLGRRDNTFCEVLVGLTEGEEVVTAATFLIDAESNLGSALKTFSPPDKSP
jgi:Cu(I)/Ag(I) efflux system membrane fusion protein